jgi:hypothetical protein
MNRQILTLSSLLFERNFNTLLASSLCPSSSRALAERVPVASEQLKETGGHQVRSNSGQPKIFWERRFLGWCGMGYGLSHLKP